MIDAHPTAISMVKLRRLVCASSLPARGWRRRPRRVMPMHAAAICRQRADIITLIAESAVVRQNREIKSGPSVHDGVRMSSIISCNVRQKELVSDGALNSEDARSRFRIGNLLSKIGNFRSFPTVAETACAHGSGGASSSGTDQPRLIRCATLRRIRSGAAAFPCYQRRSLSR